MSIKNVAMVGALMFFCLGAIHTYGVDNAQPGAGFGIGTITGVALAKQLGKLIPGKSTKAQVQSLLGTPWRTVQYNDLDQLEDEIWEYRVIDPTGSYRLHIEFDHHDVVHIVGKIPDRARERTPVQAEPQNSPMLQ
jgi:hypothetical protein